MESLYISELNKSFDHLTLNESESRHTKAMRLGVGDEVLITNGNGLMAKCTLTEISKSGNVVKCNEFFENYNELESEITVAVGILDNTERFEFLIEKSVELGAKVIVPLITKYSSNKSVRYERANSKIIAALKQSKRSIAPVYSPPISIDKLYDNFDAWDVVVLADENGENTINISKNDKVLILCGPEGGFTDAELSNISKAKNLCKVKLAASRLRSETAAIAALSKVVSSIL